MRSHNTRRRARLAGLAGALTVAGLATPAATEETAAEFRFAASAEAPLVIHTTDDSGAALPVTETMEAEIDTVRAAADEGTTWRFDRGTTRAAATTGGLSVHYVTGQDASLPPADVQFVVDEAIRRWNAVLDTDATIVVDFIWTSLGPNLLGAGGPTTIHRDGLPPAGGTYYPAALANHISGADANGSTQAEIEIILNSDRYPSGGWYTDLSGSAPGFGSRDLLSTVVHEIAHGLGFLGSATGDGNDGGVWGAQRLIYDRLAEHDGVALFSLPDGEDELTGGAVDIDLGGDRNFELYAPGVFITGSSFSHFDESSYGPGEAGALMTPVLSSGEIERTIDGATLAVLSRLGWDLAVPVASPELSPVVPGGAGKLTLNWVADSFADSSVLPPTSFTVEVYDGADLVTSGTFSATDTGVNITGLEDFVDHRLVVTANHTTGRTASATTHSEGRPAYVSIAGSGSSRTISWTAPDGAGTASPGYQVERRLVGSPTWTRIASPTGTSITDTGLAEGVYQYRVRAVTAAGTSPWRLSTIEGVSADVDRPMPLDGQVARLYAAALGRSADAGGLGFWMDARAEGQGLETIAGQFAASTEFTTSYGSLSDAAFVDQVYLNVLGRPADAGGRAFWIGQLAAGRSRGSVIVGFSESTEYVTRTGTGAIQSTFEGRVYRLYMAYFLREPDTGGFDFWVSQVAAGTDLRAVSDSFAQSSEFADTYGAVTDERFVDLVYRNVLGRNADAGGRAHWLAQLTAGTTRGEMMVGFSESPEFILQTGTTP